MCLKHPFRSWAKELRQPGGTSSLVLAAGRVIQLTRPIFFLGPMRLHKGWATRRQSTQPSTVPEHESRYGRADYEKRLGNFPAKQNGEARRTDQ